MEQMAGCGQSPVSCHTSSAKFIASISTTKYFIVSHLQNPTIKSELHAQYGDHIFGIVIHSPTGSDVVWSLGKDELDCVDSAGEPSV